LRNLVWGLALVAISACAGWDNSKQLKDLEPSEKTALCDYAYDAWGGESVSAFCTPSDSGQLVPLYIGQGERQEAVDACVADRNQTRWVDCPVADFVTCLQETDAKGDLCASQTEPTCLRLAGCVADLGCTEDRDCARNEVCTNSRCVVD
jgi:hypothetical protein